MDLDVSAQPLPGDQGTADQGAAQAPSITSLDSLSEFEFQGEKYTPERLQEMLQGYQSYGRKVQEYESEAKYIKNLDIDLESVAQNPALASEFKRIYPQRFHALVDRLLGKSQGEQQTQGAIPKEFLNEFGQLKSGYQSMREQLHQMAVESANAKLEATLPKLWEKFPLAVEDAVLARAEGFLANGGKLTEQVWERLAKESHEAVRKKADSHYKKELQTQIHKGKEGGDIGPGGAAPGKAPPRTKTFDEAREQMIAHLKAQGGF